MARIESITINAYYGRCKDCESWMQFEYLPPEVAECVNAMNTCEDYIKPDGIGVDENTILFGPMFGCVHFKQKLVDNVVE